MFANNTPSKIKGENDKFTGFCNENLRISVNFPIFPSCITENSC